MVKPLLMVPSSMRTVVHGVWVGSNPVEVRKKYDIFTEPDLLFLQFHDFCTCSSESHNPLYRLMRNDVPPTFHYGRCPVNVAAAIFNRQFKKVIVPR